MGGSTIVFWGERLSERLRRIMVRSFNQVLRGQTKKVEVVRRRRFFIQRVAEQCDRWLSMNGRRDGAGKNAFPPIALDRYCFYRDHRLKVDNDLEIGLDTSMFCDSLDLLEIC
jgi:hypothetical protein